MCATKPRLPPIRFRASSRLLGTYLDDCSDGYKRPDFLDLGVSHGHTSVRPVYEAMKRTQPGEGALETVNFNFATRVHAVVSGALSVSGAWVRDVESEIESALGLFRIDHVQALWRLVIATTFLRTYRLSTQCNLINSQGLPVLHEGHGMRGFYNHDSVYQRSRR